jgi:hypothetical protein
MSGDVTSISRGPKLGGGLGGVKGFSTGMWAQAGMKK